MASARPPARTDSQRRAGALIRARDKQSKPVTDESALVAIRTARLAAIVALVTALVSLGGTAYSVIYSSKTEDTRSQTEFIRSQRQALYAQLVNDDAAATEEENRLYLRSNKAERTRILGVGYNPSTPQYLALNRQLGAVTVLGSSDVRASMQALVAAHREYEFALTAHFRGQSEVPFGDLMRIGAAQNVLKTTQARFFEAARADVGNK